MVLFNVYFSKKEMQEKLTGKPASSLRFTPTAIDGSDCNIPDNGKIIGAHRPAYNGALSRYKLSKSGKMSAVKSKEFYATVVIKDGIIIKIT